MKDYLVGTNISTSRDIVTYRFPHKACLFRLSMINHPTVKHLAWETLDVTPCNDALRLKLRSDACVGFRSAFLKMRESLNRCSSSQVALGYEVNLVLRLFNQARWAL